MFLVFYIEKSYNYGAHTIRYDLDGSHYYLCVEGNKVFLQVSCDLLWLWNYHFSTVISHKQITYVTI